jgi:hypothetical protein
VLVTNILVLVISSQAPGGCAEHHAPEHNRGEQGLLAWAEPKLTAGLRNTPL